MRLRRERLTKNQMIATGIRSGSSSGDTASSRQRRGQRQGADQQHADAGKHHRQHGADAQRHHQRR